MPKPAAHIAAATLLLFSVTALAQHAPDKPIPSSQIAAMAGDSNPEPGQMADLSPKLSSPDIHKAMRVVADWQLGNAAHKWNQDWTYAPLYLGLLATSETLHDPLYHDAVLHLSEQFNWKLWNQRPLHADDEAIGQSYELLYQEKPDPIRIADTRETFDRLVAYQDKSSKDLWWWCDALFMAPPGLARMSAITGDHKYIDAMNREWALTEQHLYDKQEHLFFRDRELHNGKTYQQTPEKNGQKLFWARGNGWVLAGLADVLKTLPKNDPSRPHYIALFKEMSDRIAGLQQPDGLWHTGLLDQTAYELPEISGSAFFTYAMAWAGMLQHVYADGRLGCIQPIGAAPGAFQLTSSYVYGVGGFLLAGSELDKLTATGKKR